MNDAIKKKYTRAPHKPGVYMFRDKRDIILYIGKARDLKKRLASYIVSKKHLPRIRNMLTLAQKLEWIITDNELEALILEASLIRKEKPRYNIALKDDKRYPYLKITREKFPRILVVRHKENDCARYFGPYADRVRATRLVHTIRKFFRIRSCNYVLPSKREIKPCMLLDIGRCIGPCVDTCNEAEYAEAVDNVVLFLRGKRTELIEKLRLQMEQASTELRFETAARLRDTIGEFERMLRPQKMDSDLADRDFITVVAGAGVGVAVVFRVRQGAMIARQTFPLTVPKKETLGESINEFLNRYYAEDSDVPQEIIVPEKPTELNELIEFLAKLRGKSVSIKVPQKGRKYETMILVQRNAELIHGEMMLQKQKVHIPYGLLELERHLDLSKPPNLIEAFDISNFGAETIVASMVQFSGGRANRSEYRHYRIKTVSGQDDFASMREVVFRRYRRQLEENKKLPDLILIDGGKGQLSAAMDALTKLKLDKSFTVIAIAKRLDELFLADNSEPVNLPKDSAALRLLQRIRDEAHRFAITFSRKKHRKKLLELELTRVEGIGEKRAKKLLKEFGGLNAIEKATIEELISKGKLPKAIAGALKEKLGN